mmetsp:Transcript_8323/g.34280  ORF Transcript_8323/g.34280 Transcript_8323/m.34280 type:complete len:414 (-) Transcript_8323:27-1268(-)
MQRLARRARQAGHRRDVVIIVRHDDGLPSRRHGRRCGDPRVYEIRGRPRQGANADACLHRPPGRRSRRGAGGRHSLQRAERWRHVELGPVDRGVFLAAGALGGDVAVPVARFLLRAADGLQRRRAADAGGHRARDVRVYRAGRRVDPHVLPLFLLLMFRSERFVVQLPVRRARLLGLPGRHALRHRLAPLDPRSHDLRKVFLQVVVALAVSLDDHRRRRLLVPASPPRHRRHVRVAEVRLRDGRHLDDPVHPGDGVHADLHHVFRHDPRGHRGHDVRSDQHVDQRRLRGRDGHRHAARVRRRRLEQRPRQRPLHGRPQAHAHHLGHPAPPRLSRLRALAVGPCPPHAGQHPGDETPVRRPDETIRPRSHRLLCRVRRVDRPLARPVPLLRILSQCVLSSFCSPHPHVFQGSSL